MTLAFDAMLCIQKLKALQPGIIRGQDLLLRLVLLEDDMYEGEETLVLTAVDYNKCRIERELDHWVSQQQAI